VEPYLLLVMIEEAFRTLESLPLRKHCESRGRSRHPADLSPTRSADRGLRLHRLLGLLPARHPWPALTPRSVLEKFAAVQMIDVHLSTTDGR
jgi:hypothetical protein